MLGFFMYVKSIFGLEKVDFQDFLKLTHILGIRDIVYVVINEIEF